MKVLSLGGGVQSSTLLIMACRGEVERPDLAIFADTGWEPRSVYTHLEKLMTYASTQGIRVETVQRGNLRADALDQTHRFASMPLFTRDSHGKVSMLQRQCTSEYKLGPIYRRLRELGATAKNPVEVWVGISTDEVTRMKPARVLYARNRWPLVELGMDRSACRNYLDLLGWDVPKSSCIGCPFHDDQFWSRLKTDSPVEFDDAVDFDLRIRTNARLRDEVFLHRSGRALDQVIFESDVKQTDLFDIECEGMCGV